MHAVKWHAYFCTQIRAISKNRLTQHNKETTLQKIKLLFILMLFACNAIAYAYLLLKTNNTIGIAVENIFIHGISVWLQSAACICTSGVTFIKALMQLAIAFSIAKSLKRLLLKQQKLLTNLDL